MSELLIQRYLRSGKTLEDLKAEYGIKARPHGTIEGLWSIKYNQIESPMGEAIVQECRGIILDENDNWSVVARPFDKFFNHGEGHAHDIEWGSARVFEKVDGSLMILYFYEGEWHIASSGTPDAAGRLQIGEHTFASLFWETFRRMGLTLPGEDQQHITFMFEMTSPYNRVVVRYTEASLTLLGARCRITGRDFCLETTDVSRGYPVVRSYSLSSLEAILATMDDIDPMDQEGYIVRDATGNRIKIKSPAYVAIHHLKDGIGQRRFIEIARTGETSEFLTHFPEYTEEYTRYKNMVDGLVAELEKTYARIRGIEEQKTFALEAQKTKGPGFLFQMRKAEQQGRSVTFRQLVAAMNIKALERLLGLKAPKKAKEA